MKLDQHYGESAYSIRSVCKWFQNVQSGNMSTSAAELYGLPVEATSSEMIDRVRDMVMDDRGMKLYEFASAVGIS